MLNSSIAFILHFFSKLINPNNLKVCRFEPSCTCYAKQALDAHPSWIALALVAKRLWRCRPFGPSGYDPVPAPHQKYA